MTYYCLAVQERQTFRWLWKATALTSLQDVFQLLRSYSEFLPQDHIRVFSSSSKEELHELLSRENNGLPPGSVTAAQFLHDRIMGVPERAQSASVQDVSAQAIQQGAPNVTSLPLRGSIATTGTAESLGMSLLDKKRLEFELGPGGDHDIPYSFVLPVSMPQVLAWMRLLARVQRGELVP